jgi:hypothetical protein
MQPLRLAIVARENDRKFADQTREIATEVRRAVAPGAAVIDERIVPGDAVLPALAQTADVLVLMGHTHVDDEWSVISVLGVAAADLRGVLRTHALVLNTCFLGKEQCLRDVDQFVATSSPPSSVRDGHLTGTVRFYCLPCSSPWSLTDDHRTGKSA